MTTIIKPPPAQINECILESRCGRVEELTAQIRELLEENKKILERLEESEALIEKLTGMLRAQLNDRFNKHSEKSKYINPGENAKSKESQTEKEESPPFQRTSEPPTPVKKRTPHGRIIPINLPVVEQTIEIPEGERDCGLCGKPYRQTSMREESNEIDVQIKIVRNRIKRVKYAKICECETEPEIIVAEKPPNIIYKSLYSTSLWVLLLYFKYCLQIPLFRQIEKMWIQNGSVLKNSTVIGGFKKLHETLIPLHNAMIKKSKTEKHWSADETSWKVFTDKQEKKTFNWWMWVFASENVAVYILDRTRSAEVPKKHLGDGSVGILNVDRYAAYKILAPLLLLALCWYHVRRDFIKAAVSFPSLSEWANRWIDMIAELERINDSRVEAFVGESPRFASEQALLECKIQDFFENCERELGDPASADAKKKIFKSLLKNKDGLTIFVDNPLVPMHNNLAERSLRPLAVARKNFYGSHAPWSGELAAICMSIYTTALLYNIEPRAYLEYYFNVCAANDSKPPDNIEPLLFWNLSGEVLERFNLRSDKEATS